MNSRMLHGLLGEVTVKAGESRQPASGSAAGRHEADGGSHTLAERRARRQARSAERIRVVPPERFTKERLDRKLSVLDAAAFLVRIPKPLSWLKLQDLLYFAQAWHLVWDEELLFPEDITATHDGIEIAEIDSLLTGRFEVTPGHLRRGRPDRLDESRQQTLSGIVKFYADRSHFRLNDLIVSAEPWLNARKGAEKHEKPVIPPVELHRHYRNLE